MATLFPAPKIQFIDENGLPRSGAKVFTYAAGTSTKKTTWKDQGKVAANTNPIILDSAGMAAMWGDGSYKVVVAPSTDTDPPSSPYYTVDNINLYDTVDWTGLTASIADINSTTTTTIDKTIDYSIVIGDRGKTILVDASSGNINISLLAAATAGDGYKITIKKVDVSSNTVTLTPNGVQTVDAQTTYVLHDYNDFVTIICDGSNWKLVASQIRGTVRSITAETTLTLNDNNKLIECDATSASFLLNLPEIASVGIGYKISVKKIDSTANTITITPDGTDTIDGASSKAINTQYVSYTLISGSSEWYLYGEYGTSSSTKNPLPKGYVYGLVISNDAGDVNHDISFSAGEARDSSDTVNGTLSSAMVKRIDANWVAGTGNGGFPASLSLTVSTWYHCFIIMKEDGTTDAGFDTSASAANLLVNTGAPYLAGYRYYRRVGSVRADASSNILQFVMINYNNNRIVYWITPTSQSFTDPGTSAQLVTVITPLGLSVESILSLLLVSGTNNIDGYISSPLVSDTVAGDPGENFYGNNGLVYAGQYHIVTNTSSQIRYRILTSTGTTVIEISSVGWVENL